MTSRYLIWWNNPELKAALSNSIHMNLCCIHSRVFCLQAKTLPFASSQVKREHRVLPITSIAQEYKWCLKPISSVLFFIWPETRNLWNLWNCHKCFQKSEEKYQLTCPACQWNILLFIYIKPTLLSFLDECCNWKKMKKFSEIRTLTALTYIFTNTIEGIILSVEPTH